MLPIACSGLATLGPEEDDVSMPPLWASLPLVPPSSDRASEAEESAAARSPARRRAKAGKAGRRTGRLTAPVAVPPEPPVVLDSPKVVVLGDVDEAAIARGTLGGSPTADNLQNASYQY